MNGIFGQREEAVIGPLLINSDCADYVRTRMLTIMSPSSCSRLWQWNT